MIVECRKCRILYRFDSAKIKDTGTKVRCSRCLHEFTVSRSSIIDSVELFSEMKIAEEAYSFRQAIRDQMQEAEQWNHPQK